MLIEKLESQLKAEDLIKPELNGNLAADWMAFTPMYDLLEAPRGLLRERGAPFKLLECNLAFPASSRDRLIGMLPWLSVGKMKAITWRPEQ